MKRILKDSGMFSIGFVMLDVGCNKRACNANGDAIGLRLKVIVASESPIIDQRHLGSWSSHPALFHLYSSFRTHLALPPLPCLSVGLPLPRNVPPTPWSNVAIVFSISLNSIVRVGVVQKRLK